MTKVKVDIISGFLGAGKTTLLRKLIGEGYSKTGEKIVLIENEFGEIGIDGGFLQESGIKINEMNSGCICCSLVGDFHDALTKVLDDYAPDRILIEPSGVGKLSDIIRAVQGVGDDRIALNTFTVVVDVNKCKLYMKNFGEFFNDQIANAGCIVFSHTDHTTDKKLTEAVALVREKNATATLVTTPVAELDCLQLIETMERKDTIAEELARLAATAEAEDDDDDECCCHHHHHDDDDDDDDHECCHHHHHHDDDDDDDDDHDHECHHHHHHDDDDHECCHHHDDDDDHDHECHHHHHHHHHHADEVFTSFGKETVKKFDEEELRSILAALQDAEKYGAILRAKGIVEGTDGRWIHFDYVPGEPDVRHGAAGVIGKICVIGSNLNEDAVAGLFGV